MTAKAPNTPLNSEWLTLVATDPPDFGKELMAKLHLLCGVAVNSTDERVRENSIITLRNVAVQAATMLEALYIDDHKGARRLIEKTVRRHEVFVQTYNFTYPTALNKKPTKYESDGDEARRSLMEDWYAHNLRYNPKTPDNRLVMFIQSFYKAVMEPMDVSRYKHLTGEDFMTFVYNGGLSIPEGVRSELKGSRDAGLWSKYCVEYYEELSPWPFRDGEVGLSWPNDDEEAERVIRDPIHLLVWRRLKARMKANPDDHSVRAAFYQLVKERFDSFFHG